MEQSCNCCNLIWRQCELFARRVAGLSKCVERDRPVLLQLFIFSFNSAAYCLGKLFVNLSRVRVVVVVSRV